MKVKLHSNQFTAIAYQDVNGSDELMFMPASGKVTVTLLCYSLGTEMRNKGPIEEAKKCELPETDPIIREKFGSLFKSAQIILNKGFRIDYDTKLSCWGLLDRISVSGIKRILNYSDDGLTCLEEAFGNHIMADGRIDSMGSAFFAYVCVHANLADISETIHRIDMSDRVESFMGHEEADNTVNKFHKSRNRTKSIHKTENEDEKFSQTKKLARVRELQHQVTSHDGREYFEIPRPLHTSNIDNVFRSVALSPVSSRADRGKIVKHDVGKQITYQLHTATSDVEERALATGLNIRSLYPHDIKTKTGFISVHVVTPPQEVDPDLIMRVDSIIDELSLSTTKLHSVRPRRAEDVLEKLNDWHFVTEGERLKLLSPLSIHRGRGYDKLHGDPVHYSWLRPCS